MKVTKVHENHIASLIFAVAVPGDDLDVTPVAAVMPRRHHRRGRGQRGGRGAQNRIPGC